MANYRNSTNIQTQVTKENKQDTYETKISGTNTRIPTHFSGTPGDKKLKIKSVTTDGDNLPSEGVRSTAK